MIFIRFQFDGMFHIVGKTDSKSILSRMKLEAIDSVVINRPDAGIYHSDSLIVLLTAGKDYNLAILHLDFGMDNDDVIDLTIFNLGK